VAHDRQPEAKAADQADKHHHRSGDGHDRKRQHLAVGWLALLAWVTDAASLMRTRQITQAAPATTHVVADRRSNATARRLRQVLNTLRRRQGRVSQSTIRTSRTFRFESPTEGSFAMLIGEDGEVW
jgi:hypothetical protein